MAVDTRNKRASVLGLTLAALVVLPAPDGTVAAAARLQVSASYAGVAAASPVIAPTPAMGELTATGARSYMDATMSASVSGLMTTISAGGSMTATTPGGTIEW